MGREAKSKDDGPLHAVLTGDIVASRKAPDREALQQALRDLVGLLNHTFDGIVEVPFSISLGDEFQGVLQPVGKLLTVADTIRRELFPVRARVGIGIGGIATAFAARSQEMDGPAFLFAREALDEARAAPSLLGLNFRTPDEGFDLGANATALLLCQAKERWRALHWRRAHLRDLGWGTERIAAEEGCSQPSIHQSLSNMGYAPLRQAEAGLAALIDRQQWYRSLDL